MKRLRRLSRRRSSRSEENAFLIDGPTLVAEALDASVVIESVYFEEALFDRRDEGVIISRLEDDGVAAHEVTPGGLQKVLDLGSPQSVVAVAKRSPVSLDGLLDGANEHRRPIVIAAGIADPGNAGTLIRVAEAAGCAGVAFTSGSVDVWNPKVVRGSAGALFRVPVTVDVSDTALAEACLSAEIDLLATVPRDAAVPESLDLGGVFAILVGSESHGIPMELDKAAEIRVTIPMDGEVESLNAGVSAAVLAFEAARQRRLK